MKRYTPRHVDSLRATFKYFPASVILGLLTLLPGVVIAQQVETTADCDEGVIPEPVALVYGNSTVGCAISPSTENDRFVFNGLAGEIVRINLLALTNDLDPVLEVRDDMNNPVGGGVAVRIVSARAPSRWISFCPRQEVI